MKNIIKPMSLLKITSRHSLLTAMIVSIFSFFGLTDAVKSEVVISVDGEVEKIETQEDTVGDLFKHLGIKVTSADRLSHLESDKIEDGMTIEYTKAKSVVVVTEGEAAYYKTFETHVKDFYQAEKIKFSKHDDVSHLGSEKIEDGLVINITEAYELDIINVDDTETVWTTGGTVEEILAENNIAPKRDDKVTPDLDEEVTEGMEIEVIKVTEELVIEEEKIEYKTKRKKDNSLLKGYEKVIQEGKNGYVAKTYELTLENDRIAAKEKIKEEIIEEAEEEIIVIGTKVVDPVKQTKVLEKVKPKAEPNHLIEYETVVIEPVPKEKEISMTMEATAYTAECTGCSGITKTGINLLEDRYKKVVAVDPRVIPLGSKVWVSGYGEAIAGDIGGDIKGNRIDLHYPNKKAAYKFGRRSVTVIILK